MAAERSAVGSDSDAGDAEPGAAVFDVGAATDVGSIRDRNEDSLFVSDLSGNYELRETGSGHFAIDDGVLVAVFDGMGGAASGDLASRTAAEVVQRELGTLAGISLESGDAADRLFFIARAANDEIRQIARSKPDCEGMGTTIICGVLIDSRFVFLHLGDSRAYLLRKGELHQITEDQSLRHQLVAEGHLAAEEAGQFEFSNVILQALGVSAEIEPFVGEVALCDGDQLLLCTDGLTDMLPDDVVRDLLNGDAAVERLVEQAKQEGGHDNITVVLVRVRGDTGFPGGPIEVREVHVPALEAFLRRRRLLRVVWGSIAAVLLMVAVAVLIMLLGGVV